MGPYYQLLNNNNDNKQKHIACTLFRRYCASAESPVRVLHMVINTDMMVCVCCNVKSVHYHLVVNGW